jgi:hypothetical protein
MGSIPSSLSSSDILIHGSQEERESLDPSSQISSDQTQASLLTTKLGSMDQKKKRESLVGFR